MPPAAHRVAPALAVDMRGFELDHLGAHVAEQLPAEGAGDELPHLDHANAGERALVGRIHGYCAAIWCAAHCG